MVAIIVLVSLSFLGAIITYASASLYITHIMGSVFDLSLDGCFCSAENYRCLNQRFSIDAVTLPWGVPDDRSHLIV